MLRQCVDAKKKKKLPYSIMHLRKCVMLASMVGCRCRRFEMINKIKFIKLCCHMGNFLEPGNSYSS